MARSRSRPADTAGPGNTGQFDILVNLTTPFLYNPTAESLLFNIRDSSTVSSPFYVDLATDMSANPTTRLNFVGRSTTAATGNVQDFGIVTRFAFTPAPEPSQWASLGLGVLGLASLGLSAKKKSLKLASASEALL